MRFRILGPLEVLADGTWEPIGAEKWRSLLAYLLVRAGEIVSTDALADELWGDDPPAKAKNLISIYVLRLRRLLGDAEGTLLAWRAPGYVLNIADGDLDSAHFDSLVADGDRALADGDPVRAVALLAAGLDLWRGPFLADVPPTPLIMSHSERAGELRLTATELWAAGCIACDRHSEVIPELHKLVGEQPLREGLWLQLIRALDGAGRHAEALGTYAQAREAISEELGVEPGAELQRLYADLLAADSAGAAEDGVAPAGASRLGTAPGEGRSGAVPPGQVPGTIRVGRSAELVLARVPMPTAEESAGPPIPRPAQLPADIENFTGREAHVRHLRDMLLQEAPSDSPGTVPIAFLAGAGGLGKTTLAVHAAHQVRDHFPDGQLYVDLLGATPQPLRPGDVLARFLRDLGIDGDKVPARDEERAALYRTRLAGRRVLILLDNARDAAQVRPLLPGSASCAVLVTTRNRTADLASTRFFDLNVLDDDEALTLFTRILGEERALAEPEATAEVLVACAGLPLAIRICAARLAARHQWKIATMAKRLRDERRRLDELKVGDLAVRASFQVSYDSVGKARHGADPKRAFRLLGLWQGPCISLQAAVALYGPSGGTDGGEVSEDDVADALESLVDAHLLESPEPDWYRLHDLLRVYATERARAEESDDDRAAAVERLLGWYLSTAEAAAQVIAPHRYRVPDTEGSEDKQAPAAAGPPMTSVEAALGWYHSERENLVAASRQASAAGLHDIAWRLPCNLFPIFNRRHNMADCVTTSRIAVASARVAQHRQGEAWALQNLGQALAKVGDEEALVVLEQALAIRRDIGDHTGEAQTAVSLADAYHNIQGASVAYEHSLRCLEILREVGNGSLLAVGLVNHGEYSQETGRLDEAAECFREAYQLWQEIGGYGQGWALHNLGHVHLVSGRFDEATACLDDAHRLHQTSGDLIGQATALKYLGEAQQASGNAAAAQEARDTALAILDGLKQDVDVAGLYASIASMSASGARETLVDAKARTSDRPGTPPAWSGALTGAEAEGTPALTWSSQDPRGSGPGARRPPDSDRPAHEQQEEKTPGDGHDGEPVDVPLAAEHLAGETAAKAEPDDHAAADDPAEDNLTEGSRPRVPDEAVLAVLRTILAAQGIVDQEQAAAYLATLVQSWPDAAGHAPETPGKADALPVPAPVEVIPDAPGHEQRPDPLAARTPADFVRALNLLRVWAGKPPFREMEQLCGRAVASATICTALKSDKLPSLHIVHAIITACGGEEQKRAFTTAWRKLAMEQEPPGRRSKQPAERRLYPIHGTG